MLRKNSGLRSELGENGYNFLEYCAGAVERILPHVESGSWIEEEWQEPGAFWTDVQRREFRLRVSIGSKSDGRTVSTVVARRSVPVGGNIASQTLDIREHDICKRIAKRISLVLATSASTKNDVSLSAIRNAFDEQIIAEHLKSHHTLELELADVFQSLHELAEETYENKSLTFGCLLDPNQSANEKPSLFPRDLLESKKYKALSDGFRTAYHVSCEGAVINFLDLRTTDNSPLSSSHFYPQWAEDLAAANRGGRCGLCLSRHGDVLVFDEGNLRFSYRYGRWQLWNHRHLVNLLKNRARAQHVQPAVLGKVVSSIYRAALDVSFRRSGGLFVVLRNRKHRRCVVRSGDAVGDSSRQKADREFDNIVRSQKIQTLPRAIAAELASLDGAVVLDNGGRILAYGAVLDPKKKGRLRGTEGSRTKAAIGASNYGLAIKISSDGDITVYHDGEKFIRM